MFLKIVFIVFLLWIKVMVTLVDIVVIDMSRQALLIGKLMAIFSLVNTNISFFQLCLVSLCY